MHPVFPQIEVVKPGVNAAVRLHFSGYGLHQLTGLVFYCTIRQYNIFKGGQLIGGIFLCLHLKNRLIQKAKLGLPEIIPG